MTDGPPTLFEWAGGAAALERLTRTFYEEVRRDPVLEPVFRHMDKRHPQHVAVWLGEVFGGPPLYTEEHGGYAQMVSKHLGKALTEQQRRRWVELMLDAADRAALPDDPEFRSAFVAYIEWGTRLAVRNSQPGVTPPAQPPPVPRWGWGGRRPTTRARDARRSPRCCAAPPASGCLSGRGRSCRTAARPRP